MIWRSSRASSRSAVVCSCTQRGFCCHSNCSAPGCHFRPRLPISLSWLFYLRLFSLLVFRKSDSLQILFINDNFTKRTIWPILIKSLPNYRTYRKIKLMLDALLDPIYITIVTFIFHKLFSIFKISYFIYFFDLANK